MTRQTMIRVRVRLLMGSIRLKKRIWSGLICFISEAAPDKDIITAITEKIC